MIQPTLVNLQSSKYSEDFSTIRLHKDVLKVVILLRTYLIKYVSQTEQYVSQSMCPKQNSMCPKVCVPNRTEDLNLSAFNMITGINQSKN